MSKQKFDLEEYEKRLIARSLGTYGRTLSDGTATGMRKEHLDKEMKKFKKMDKSIRKKLELPKIS